MPCRCSPRLGEDASVRVEVAVGVLLEDALAGFLVEGVDPALVAELQRRRLRERRAAHRTVRRHDRSSSMSGCRARTSCPLSATMRRTVPLSVERISLNSFIASMSPITTPAATLLPICTNDDACRELEREKMPVSGAAIPTAAFAPGSVLTYLCPAPA